MCKALFYQHSHYHLQQVDRPLEQFLLDHQLIQSHSHCNYQLDLVIFDLNSPWKVSKDNLLYKCNWSPFENKTFKSRILHTLVNGNLVFSHGKIIESGKGMKIMFER